VILETLLVACAGVTLGLVANAISPVGLRLTRDYFPAPRTASPSNRSSDPAEKAHPADASAATAQRLQQHGLQVVNSNEVAALFHDPAYQQGQILFIDARDDQHYHTGHVPGAWQFNHYRAEQFFPTILPLCLSAQKAVVYCGGGACEDSEFAAIMLRDAGVPSQNLYVYPGGIGEWKTNGLPIEIGPRQSGQLTNATQ
jgi:rhodanese-related sulfurtransferase